MKNSLRIVLSTILIFLSGCYTTGLSPRESGGTTYNQLVYGLYSQQEDTSAPSPIVFPIKIGIAQIGETSPNKALIKEIKKHPDLFSEVIELPLPGIDHRENKNAKPFHDKALTLRNLGKQFGATHILMVGGHIDSRSLSNPIEMLDILILPSYVIPSQKIEIEAKASAAFVETETGRVLFLTNTTSEAHGYTASSYVREKRETLSLQQRDVLSKKIVNAFIDKLKK